MFDKSTTDLFHELNSTSNKKESFARFRDTNLTQQLCSLQDYLNEYLANHPDLYLRTIISDSNVDRGYAYQIFNGRKKHPDKYKLILICAAMHMSPTEINRALFLADQPKLYPRKEIDAALIVCINEGLHTYLEISDYLASQDLALPQ